MLAVVPFAAQAQIGGAGQFPQFRSMSGMPGSGYGVTADGRIAAKGAWSIATPIAYNLRPWQVSLGLGSLSPNSSPRFLDTSGGESKGNGTGQVSLGLPLGKYGSATYTLMILSGRWDNASNLTYTLPFTYKSFSFGVGVQDLGGGGGTQGEGPGGKDPGNSRSWFGVVTWENQDGLHASIGAGSNRFDSVFGNASANLTEQIKAVVEYDKFNWNVGLGYDLPFGKAVREGHDAGASLFFGLVRGKYAYWSLNLRF